MNISDYSSLFFGDYLCVTNALVCQERSPKRWTHLSKADEEVAVVGANEPFGVVAWRPLEDGCKAAAGENALQRQLQHHSVRSARSGRAAFGDGHVHAEWRLPRFACSGDMTVNHCM